MRYFRAFLLISSVSFALGGCKDYGKCLASHEEKYEWLQQVWIGNITIGQTSIPQYTYLPQTGIRTVYDRNEFPEGR